jgi:hypothetical protein
MALQMKPIVVLSNAKQQCTTFLWKENPDYYIGYRFIEHKPEIMPAPLFGVDALPTAKSKTLPEPDKSVMPKEEGDPWMMIRTVPSRTCSPFRRRTRSSTSASSRTSGDLRIRDRYR